MPRFSPLEPAFNAGELSPRLHARLDFNKYRAGLEECVNLIPLPEGGVMRRPGTRYIAEVADSARKGRLKPFVFSVTQAYMLEFGHRVVRFFTNQGQLTVGALTTAITNGTFDSDISGWSNLSTGSGAISWGSVGDMDMVPGGTAADDIAWAEQSVTTAAPDEVHVLRFRIKALPSDKLQVRIGTSSGDNDVLDTERQVGYHSVEFTPGASPYFVQFRNLGSFRNKTLSIDDVSLIDDAPLELTTVWTDADLTPDAGITPLNGPQSGDVLYLFHASNPPHRLVRYGHRSWSLVETPFGDGPYLPENLTATTLTPSAASGLNITLTLSSTEGVNDGQGWLSTDVRRHVRYKKSSSWGWAIIRSITSPTVARADVRAGFEAAPDAQTTWRLGSWSGTTGWPEVGSFFESRLYVAATDFQPRTLWASQTGNFTLFRPDDQEDTIEEDDAIDVTLAGDGVNAIRWLSAGEDTLAIGTDGGEWVPRSEGAVITPLDITVRRQTKHGTAVVQPVRVGNAVLFVQRAGRKIREFGVSPDSVPVIYVAPDMTRLAEHITKGGIVEMAYAEEPDSLVWAIRADGLLLSLTYRRAEDVVGWARQPIGGSFSSGAAVVDSVAVIPGDDGSGQIKDSRERDEVWLIVKRTIDGATKRYVEMFEGYHEPGDDQDDAYYVDSCITYDGAATTAISGLDHLEGETVKVWADGAIRPDAVVASGAITLGSAASVAQIGLPYAHRLKTLKIADGNPAGTPLGKHRRVYGMTFMLLNSHTLRFGPSDDPLTMQEFRLVADPMDAGAPLFTGEQFLEFPGPWTRDSRTVIESDDPAPFTLLAMAPEIDMNPLK